MGSDCTFGTCGAGGARPYAEGPRCDAHAPWARAGNPDPSSARYCLAVCYCGQCATGRGVPLAPVIPTIKDARDIASGKRHPRSLAEYRDAQARTRRT